MPLTGRILTVFCVTALLAGCEPQPLSLHPLANEKGCELEPQLFGEWEVAIIDKAAPSPSVDSAPADTAATDPTPHPEPPERPERWTIGRASGSDRVHELAMLRVDEEGNIEVQRMPLLATRLRDARYVSCLVKPKSAEDEGAYLLLRYRFVSPHVVQVDMLDVNFVAQAIERGELKGSVQREKSDQPNAAAKDAVHKDKLKSLRITAETNELREFIASHDNKAFGNKPVLRLQRIASQK